MPTICVFCGSSRDAARAHAVAARAFAVELVVRGHAMVTGGGRVGLMGVVADTVLERGGRVTGVIPRFLVDRELPHQDLTELHVVDSLHERKALMHELSDGFVALPGGFGTLDELAEAITWRQLGLHAKPVGLLDVDGYWSGLVDQVNRATADGLVSAVDRDLLVVAPDPASLLDRLLGMSPPREG